MATKKTAAESLGLKKQELEPIAICSVHGVVTNATARIFFDPEKPGDKPMMSIYCLKCVNDMLQSLQRDGVMGIVALRMPEDTEKAGQVIKDPPAN